MAVLAAAFFCAGVVVAVAIRAAVVAAVGDVAFGNAAVVGKQEKLPGFGYALICEAALGLVAPVLRAHLHELPFLRRFAPCADFAFAVLRDVPCVACFF